MIQEALGGLAIIAVIGSFLAIIGMVIDNAIKHGRCAEHDDYDCHELEDGW